MWVIICAGKTIKLENSLKLLIPNDELKVMRGRSNYPCKVKKKLEDD